MNQQAPECTKAFLNRNDESKKAYLRITQLNLYFLEDSSLFTGI
jgi:hypothetical protein